ncbi:uncharacterized protein LOC113351241 [Papaver somniferum]|uniref:uncharacterized protein LOC113351241 n=1 Tax=Papaver somniferum TaxID=3469 RepID=UPI000E701BC1|nr:uncharacterized protein LOC113351241 [Papaver somniferum]
MVRGRGQGGPREALVDEVMERTRYDELSRTVEQLTGQVATLSQRRERRLPPTDESNSDGTDDDNDTENPFAGRERDSRSWESSFRIEIPEFHGSGLSPEDCIDCFSTVEEVLEFKRVPDDRVVPLVATRFRGRAAVWWRQLKASRIQKGKTPISSWVRLEKCMRSALLPFNYTRELYIRLQNLRQGSRSIDEYTKEFYDLVTRSGITDTEEQLVYRYLGGLRETFQDTLNLFDYYYVFEVYQRALRLEKQLSRKSIRAAIGRPPAFSSHTASAQQEVDIAVDVFDDAEETTAEFDEVFLPGDQGECLMLYRRSFLTPKANADESWLRKNIFQTTCNIEDKVCRLIVDSGSCENVVSDEAVRKLKLPTEKHPSPYSLHWLSKGSEVTISRHCLVKFSIGSVYEDAVWCDVVVMDACHLLLGRPWKNDRAVTHDGKLNTYSFMFKNTRVTLVPSNVTVHAPISPVASNFIS